MKRVSSFCRILFITAIVFTAYCGSNAEKKVEKKVEGATAIVSIDNIFANAGDSLDVPISLENSQAIAGMQLKIQFDPKMLTVDKPRNTKRSTEMLVMHNVKENVLLIMLYNLSGKSMAPGTGPVLMVPIKVSKGATGSSALDLMEAILAKQDAQIVPATWKSGKVTIKKM